MKFAIIVSEFNAMITEPMLQECLRGFEELGFQPSVTKVPGAAEIPLMTQEIIQRENPSAIVTLGCIIEGETDHYKAICELCTQGIKDVMLKHHVPIIFEILMCRTYQDAEARIEKGYHAAASAKTMADLLDQND